MALNHTDWDDRVKLHSPRSPRVIETHERVRELIGQVGHELIDLLPAGPEAELALNALDLACMHANAAVARRHPDNHDARGQ